MSTALTARTLGDVIVVEPGAAIHLCESDLLPLVTGYLEQGFRKFVLNLQMVDYMDSAMLGGIAQSHGFAIRRGGQFVLCCCVPRLLRLFDTTKLSGVFHVVDSEEAALGSFGEAV